MKKTIFKGFFAATCIIALIACSDDDSSSSSINDLQAVNLEVTPDKEVSAKPTGRVLNGKQEYEVTTSKSIAYAKAYQMQEIQMEPTMLYPGSILRGSSFLDGVYDPLVLSTAFKPVTLFLTIKAGDDIPIKKDGVLPKGSEMFQAISDLKLGNQKYFPKEYIPANYKYESTEITNEESFKKSTQIHIKADFLSIVKGSFDYSYSKASTTSNKFVMCKLTQTVYSAGIDPKYTSDWIDGSINGSECGTHEPLYISSVDYGRVAYILVESTKNTEEVNKMISLAVEAKLKNFGASVESTYQTEFRKLFEQNKVKVSMLGGSSTAIVTNYTDFMNSLRADASYVSSAPIAYTVRRMKDNTQVQFVNYYKDIIKEFR